jgi:hypothetical protein
VAGLGVALLGSLPSPAGEDASADRINKLIEQMGNETSAEREKAMKELHAIAAKSGVHPLEVFRKAAKSDNAEVKRRAKELVKKEEEVQRKDLLAPSHVRLYYEGRLISEALYVFNLRSPCHIELHDPEGELKAGTITIDNTGKTTCVAPVETGICLRES